MEYYIANYPYQSQEQGDLTFNAGDVITVTKKDGDWWTGKIGNTVGIFPSNYVQKVDVVSCHVANETPHLNVCVVFVKNSGTNSTTTDTTTAIISAVESANAQVDNEVSQIIENKTTEKPLDSSVTANAQVCYFYLTLSFSKINALHRQLN